MTLCFADSYTSCSYVRNAYELEREATQRSNHQRLRLLGLAGPEHLTRIAGIKQTRHRKTGQRKKRHNPAVPPRVTRSMTAPVKEIADWILNNLDRKFADKAQAFAEALIKDDLDLSEMLQLTQDDWASFNRKFEDIASTGFIRAVSSTQGTTLVNGQRSVNTTTSKVMRCRGATEADGQNASPSR